MTKTETALAYLNYFCKGELDALSLLLAENFEFKGPKVEFNSREAYLASLREDPPDGFSIEIIKSFENEHEVCLLYLFTKPGLTSPMAQYFRFQDGKIAETLLIFDSGIFSQV